jgi:NADPH2:quinone reductase
MLMTRGRLRAGEDVFVWGAAAGVGAACVQYAKLAGARVFAAASTPAKAARAVALGADVAIDLSGENPVDRIRDLTRKRGCDLVVDTVGKDTWERSLRMARRGGRIVTCGATSGARAVTDLRHVFYRQLEIIGSTMGNDAELRAALDPVFDGRLAPPVGRVLPLEQAAEAHRLLESREACGKLILVP